MDLNQTIPVAPVTLPEAVGGSGEYDFTDFLDVLYISNDLISQQIKTINSKFYNLHIKRFFLCLLNVNY